MEGWKEKVAFAWCSIKVFFLNRLTEWSICKLVVEQAQQKMTKILSHDMYMCMNMSIIVLQQIVRE